MHLDAVPITLSLSHYWSLEAAQCHLVEVKHEPRKSWFEPQTPPQCNTQLHMQGLLWNCYHRMQLLDFPIFTFYWNHESIEIFTLCFYISYTVNLNFYMSSALCSNSCCSSTQIFGHTCTFHCCNSDIAEWLRTRRIEQTQMVVSSSSQFGICMYLQFGNLSIMYVASIWKVTLLPSIGSQYMAITQSGTRIYKGQACHQGCH